MSINLNEILKEFHSIVVDDGGGSITVDAVNLDIRDLAFATDKVDASGSSVSISGSVAVTSTDLDIRDLAFATDKVDVSGSTVELGATTLAALESITVSATDLDIRNLVFATDKVDVSGSSVSISGDVNVTQGTSPWVIGDGGGSITVDAVDLDIRNLAFATDKVDVSGSSITVNEGGFASWKVTREPVTTTVAEIVSTPLAGRLRMEIQNLGSQDVWAKNNNTLTAGEAGNGFKLPKGTSWQVDLDDGADVFCATESGTATLKVAEFAA